ncbi:universal stress protein [Nocardia cyriacigeorgica]|uniref:Universal stress protein n=1 Tax=Nocardia cyriacigeorgica TaxID=135487 RepID=A0A6P1CNF7_9NOCA|nr:universal stress protein [Nocardia cyriacigeorgica]NEW32716.1 universal stress protein [Nocardia cyriacigeorgica]PPJ03659.1 universal stress protein [Nocardia cyriacigeorgica]
MSEANPRLSGDRLVLAAVDGSASSYQAGAWAAAEALLHQARLHLITSTGLALSSALREGTDLSDSEQEYMRTDGERIVTEAARVARQAVGDQALSVTTEVTSDFIVPTLLDRSKRAQILAVGSRGLGAFHRGLLGSVSTAVTRHAHCPVAVTHDFAALDPVSAGKPILVGVDGTENSVPAIEYAFDAAARRNVGVVALHAWSDISSLELPVQDWDSVREAERAVLAERLAGFAEKYPDVAVRRLIVPNRPTHALHDQSDYAQMVVVGSHGRGGFASMLLGSTSNALLHTVTCPVVVVRSR